MSGCGVRSLRYALEAGADWLWVNEGNPDTAPLLAHNLSQQLTSERYILTTRSVEQVFCEALHQQRYFDLVDLDGFGSPAAYLSNSIQVTRRGGLLYLTSTDSRSCAGHTPAASLRRFGAYARAHPAAHEQGLRLLLGMASQQALMQGWGIEPIFALCQKSLYRVMVRLVPQSHWHENQSGFIGHCHPCGHAEIVGWRALSRAQCSQPNCDRPLTLSGPLWIGDLHQAQFLQAMEQLAVGWGWESCATLLAIMRAEIPFPPYFVTLAEIGRRAKIDIPKRDRLILALQAAGHPATITHINAQAIKTTASFQTCLEIARQL